MLHILETYTSTQWFTHKKKEVNKNLLQEPQGRSNTQSQLVDIRGNPANLYSENSRYFFVPKDGITFSALCKTPYDRVTTLNQYDPDLQFLDASQRGCWKDV